MNLAFLYNIRHIYPDPADPRSQQEADYDDPQTIDWMIKHLSNVVDKIIPIEANLDAYNLLIQHKSEIDLAFNYSEGSAGLDRECHIPAILEMLQIPHTGPRPQTQAIVLDKSRTKQILSFHKIPTLPFICTTSPSIKLPSQFKFPLIVKPNSQGSSAGITDQSVVSNHQEFKKQLEFVIHNFDEAIIEPFLEGSEISVAMLGPTPEILPPIQPQFSVLPNQYKKLDSLEIKWVYEENIDIDTYLKCPAPLESKLESQIQKICYKTWEVLQLQDFARIDIRCNSQNSPFVLEVNSPAGLIPPEVSTSSYLPLAARKSGLSYEQLLQRIIASAAKRYNLPYM